MLITLHRVNSFVAFNRLITGEEVVSLAGDTLTVTPIGSIPIRELEGKDTIFVPIRDEKGLLSIKGMWKDAHIKGYGEQKTIRLILSKGDNVRSVRATPDHKWPIGNICSNIFAKTENLKKGDRIPNCNIALLDDSETYWTVEEIMTGNKKEEVFCASVPGIGCFVLNDGLVTSN